MPLGVFFLFGWYADCKHITPHRYCKRCGFVRVRYGGPEGNRTPVRKPIHRTFSVGILCFEIPLVCRSQTIYTRG